MNPPISVILEVPLLKHWRYSLVRMKNLSFHLEKILSRCCHRRPLRMADDGVIDDVTDWLAKLPVATEEASTSPMKPYSLLKPSSV